MSMPFLSPLNLNKNELQNARIQNLGSAPSSPAVGQIYFDTSLSSLQIWNGSAWATTGVTAHSALTGLTIGDDHTQYVHITNARTITARHTFNPGSANSPFILGANALGQLVTGLNAEKLGGNLAAAFAAAIHTHVAADVTDFNTVVRTNRLDQLAVPTADVSLNSHKITNLTDPSGAQDAATKAYVDMISSGLDPKASVRVASTGSVNTSSPGAAIDGITLAAGTRVLLKNQSVPSENGIWIWNAAASAMNRAPDADSSAEVTPGLFTFVEEGGTNADTGWLLSTDGPITLGTTALAFTQFSAAGQITAANINLSGQGIFDAKVGTTLNFRGVAAASSKIAVALDGTNHVITIDVTESNLTLSNLGGTLSVAKGGTGGTTAALAKASLGFITRFTADIGDGTTTSIAVTHNLGTLDVIARVYDKTTPFQELIVEQRHTDTNNTTFVFTVAPTTNQYRVVILG